jgi:hypothetical protein
MHRKLIQPMMPSENHGELPRAVRNALSHYVDESGKLSGVDEKNTELRMAK